MDNIKRDVSRRRENDCVNFARTNVIRKKRKRKCLLIRCVLTYLSDIIGCRIYAPYKIQNLRRVAAKIDFFLSFCFYMQLLFDVLLYEYAGMLNRG